MLNSNIYLKIKDLNNSKNNANKSIVLATGKQDWDEVIKICSEKENLLPALGIHPYFAKQHQLIDIYNLDIKIGDNLPIALGSCGLDYVKAQKQNAQRFLFDEQISLAKNYKLPMIIYANMSGDDIIDLTKARKNLLILIHSYSGNIREVQELINMGFYISVDPKLADKNAYKLHDIVKLIPNKQILIEDNNENNISVVLKRIAKIKNIEVDELISQCNKNSDIFFNIK